MSTSAAGGTGAALAAAIALQQMDVCYISLDLCLKGSNRHLFSDYATNKLEETQKKNAIRPVELFAAISFYYSSHTFPFSSEQGA